MEKTIYIIYLILLAIPLILTQNEVIFSKESGFYSDEFLLSLSTSSGKIFYTIDGTDPINSYTQKEYKEPIQIIDRSQSPNIYGNYEEDMDSPFSISYNSKYRKPPFLLDKGFVVRAVSKYGDIYGNVTSKTYFITTEDLSQFKRFTVISLVTNPENLFDADIGIYVLGNQYIEYKKSGKYDPDKPFDSHKECNYCSKGKEWEREASITIFDNGKIVVDQNLGIRIKGQSTRDRPQKSFRVYAKKKYGKKLIKSETLFPNNRDINGNPIIEYDSFCIRAVSDDDRDRDLLVNNIIHGKMLQCSMEMKESFLFINGEFWGMYVLTEKFSEKYFSTHYNLPEDYIIFTTGSFNEDTTPEVAKFYEFMNEYSKKDLSNEDNYKEVAKVIDIDSLIESYSAGIYFAIMDWPNNNYGIWTYTGEKIDGNPYSDGKWRFMTYDYDFTMGHTQGGGFPRVNLKGGFKGNFGGNEGYEYNMFIHVENSKTRAPTNIFVALLANQEFKTKFIKYYEDFVNNYVTMDKINPIIKQFDEEISILIGYSISRWKGYLGGPKKDYIIESIIKYKEKTLPEVKKFLEERPKYTLKNMKNYFNLNN